MIHSSIVNCSIMLNLVNIGIQRRERPMKTVMVAENFMYVLGAGEFGFELHKDHGRRYIR